MSFLMILGRQPELSLAELESVFGAEAIKPHGREAALLDVESVDLSRLGGSLKVGRVLATLPRSGDLRTALLDALHAAAGESKLNFGLSFYDTKPPRGLALELKKALKAEGRSVRLVDSNGPLNAAHVIHNQLTKAGNAELLVALAGDNYVIARTEAVQDIDAYTERDRAKPVRDAKVGMLPPKLAQIIINLSRPEPGSTVLDPFCGTGTVLIEAALMGYTPYGSDLAPEMVEAASRNYAWLRERREAPGARIELADATTYRWQTPIAAVAAETFLGPALFDEPGESRMREIISEVDALHRRFISNLTPQLEPGVGLCLAVPAWFIRGKIQRLPLIDEIERFGYNLVSFKHAGARLIYRRPDQLVARELVVITRK